MGYLDIIVLLMLGQLGVLVFIGWWVAKRLLQSRNAQIGRR